MRLHAVSEIRDLVNAVILNISKQNLDSGNVSGSGHMIRETRVSNNKVHLGPLSCRSSVQCSPCGKTKLEASSNVAHRSYVFWRHQQVREISRALGTVCGLYYTLLCCTNNVVEENHGIYLDLLSEHFPIQILITLTKAQS